MTKKAIAKKPLNKKKEKKSKWYKGSVSFWNEQPATIDGVLGGFGKVDPTDIDSSEVVLK